MPAGGEKAKLTDEEKRRIDKWFKEVVQNKAVCPVCQSKNWSVAEHIVAPLTNMKPNTEGIDLGIAPLYPFFLLVCLTCSNTQFINAVSVGIVDKPKEVKP